MMKVVVNILEIDMTKVPADQRPKLNEMAIDMKEKVIAGWKVLRTVAFEAALCFYFRWLDSDGAHHPWPCRGRLSSTHWISCRPILCAPPAPPHPPP